MIGCRMPASLIDLASSVRSPRSSRTLLGVGVQLVEREALEHLPGVGHLDLGGGFGGRGLVALEEVGCARHRGGPGPAVLVDDGLDDLERGLLAVGDLGKR
jgi:hypothetical protein